MIQTVYNPHKGRLEVINNDVTDENTIWFDDHEKVVEGIKYFRSVKAVSSRQRKTPG